MGSMHCNPDYDCSEASSIKFRNLVHICKHRKVGLTVALIVLSQWSEVCKPIVSLEVCKFPLVYRIAINKPYDSPPYPYIYVVTP